MDLRVLRYVVAVADYGSISAASERVHVSQPSLSRQLRRFEAELGAELFVREGGPLRLSPAGEAFVEGARDLLRRADDVRRIAPAMRDLSQISVACPQQLFENRIAPAVLASRLALPRLKVRESVEVVELVSRGAADIGINPLRPPSSLESVVYARVPITIQAAPEANMFAPGPVELRDVPDGIVTLEPGRETRRVVDRSCADAHIAFHIEAEVETARAAQLLAVASSTSCIVSDDVPHYGLVAHPIVHDGKPLEMIVYAIWRRGHYLRPRFLEMLPRLGAES